MKLRITLVILVIAIAWSVRVWYKNYSKCSTSFIYKTCEEYKKSSIYNGLCDSICISGDFTIEGCIYSTTFNKTVFAVTINGRPTILKVNMLWFNHVKNTENSLLRPGVIFNTTAYFWNIVSRYFGSSFSNCIELTQKLVLMADSDKNGETTPSEALWFGSLLQTQETFMLAALNNSKSTVNLNGFCGALYSVEKVYISSSQLVDTSKAFTDFWALPEFAEPIESFFKDIFGELRHSYSWFETLHEKIYIFIKKSRKDKVPTLTQRLAFVIGTLEILHSMASFKYGKVMWCDILYENIGFTDLDDFSSVKLTDLDEVFSERKVFQNINDDSKKCTVNTDCLGAKYNIGLYYHVECSPYCQSNGLCSQRPQRSNLAYACAGLFFDAIFNPVVMALSERAISKEVGSLLYAILKDCAKSVEYENKDEYLASIRVVLQKIKTVKKILDLNKI